MSDAKAKFDDIAHEMTLTQHAERKMTFGAPALIANTYSFACFYHDHMVFRLEGETHAKALALSGAKLFDPMGSGQGMPNWVQVPFAHADRWRDFAFAALEVVKALPPKKPKKSLKKPKP